MQRDLELGWRLKVVMVTNAILIIHRSARSLYLSFFSLVSCGVNNSKFGNMSDTEETFEGEEEEEETEEPEAGDDDAEEMVEEEEKPEDEGAEPAEEEEKLPDNPLTEEIMAESLSLLCKTGDGLAHAYVKLDITGRELTSVELLKAYIHLRYVDVSRNSLKDISPLNALSHMLTLKADSNLLSSPRMDEMPFLQVANFNNNKITTTDGISHQLLEHLSLNYNEISRVSGFDNAGLVRLHTLELRGNRLESTAGINLPNLKNLFLGANTLKSIAGLERLTNLTTLHLRENQIEDLDGFTEDLKHLQYINLRGNNVTDVKEVGKLKVLPLLRALVLSDNPVAEEDDYRLEVLISLRKLERLDKDEYSEEERTEAEDIYEQRKLEEANESAQETILEQ